MIAQSMSKLTRRETAQDRPMSESAGKYRILDSINHVAATDWDSLLPPAEVLHAHRFNRVVEAAGVENAVLRYVVVHQNDQLAATATLAAFDIDLGLFLGKTAERWLARLRRVFPTFLRIKILVCGLPASFGQANLALAQNADTDAALGAVARAMEELAKHHGIRYLCFKEFDSAAADRYAVLERHGYFRADSLPDTYLDLRKWTSFGRYLQDLRAPYRRKIQLSLRKLGLERPEIHAFSPEKAASQQPALLYGGAEVCAPSEFYRLYLAVMARAGTKLETLNLAFFEQLYAQYAGELVVLALYRGGEVLGAALLLPAGETLLFLLVGQEQARQEETDTYFNLVYGIMEYAFRHGFRAVKTGQTAYPFKLRVGAEPRPLFLFFKAKSGIKHALLRKFRAVLFPQVSLRAGRIWKHE